MCGNDVEQKGCHPSWRKPLEGREHRPKWQDSMGDLVVFFGRMESLVEIQAVGVLGSVFLDEICNLQQQVT